MARPLATAFAVWLLLTRAAGATPTLSPPQTLCASALAAAERAHALPDRLLRAIGRIESGRHDPATQAFGAWPWTVNAEGAGYFYATKAEAIAAVREFQAHGMRSIDVGCAQINLMHHPDAFASLEAAFDPPSNAAYAASFLRTLFQQTGDWPHAVAAYHSATPELGEPYRQKVYASLTADEPQGSLLPAPTPLAAAPRAGSGAGTLPLAAFGAAFPAGRIAVSLPMMGRGDIRMLPVGGSGSAAALPQIAPPGRGLDSYRAQPVRLARGF